MAGLFCIYFDNLQVCQKHPPTGRSLSGILRTLGGCVFVCVFIFFFLETHALCTIDCAQKWLYSMFRFCPMVKCWFVCVCVFFLFLSPEKRCTVVRSLHSPTQHWTPTELLFCLTAISFNLHRNQSPGEAYKLLLQVGAGTKGVWYWYTNKTKLSNIFIDLVAYFSRGIWQHWLMF